MDPVDDSPAIEYHPFGTITLNFDDRPIKLRRCRVGDLQYAKDLLEEIRSKDQDKRQEWVEELQTLRTEITDLGEVTEESRQGVVDKLTRMRELGDLLNEARMDIVFTFLSLIAVRMGDSAPPKQEDWPIEMLDAVVPNDVLEHWQTRPLASGRPSSPLTTNQNGQSSSVPLPLEADSPPAPLPQ